MIVAVMNLLGSVAAVFASRGEGELAEIVRLATMLLQKGAQSSAELDALARQVEAMVAENRGPTDEEIAAVRAKRAALVNEILNTDLEGTS